MIHAPESENGEKLLIPYRSKLECLSLSVNFILKYTAYHYGQAATGKLQPCPEVSIGLKVTHSKNALAYYETAW